MQKAIMLSFLLLAVLGGRSLGHAQVVEAQRPSSVTEAIVEALNSNPEIQAAKKKVESARARAGQAAYLEDPEFNLEAWGIPLNRPLSYRSANPIVVGLRQKVPFFGKRGLKEEIAAQDVKMAEEELRGKEIEIVAKVKSAYADFFLANKSIELQKELLELVRQASLTADNLYRVGKAPQQDVIKALLEQTDALTKLTSAERDRTISQAKLNTLLSRPPNSPVSQLGELTLAPLSLPFSDVEKLVLQQRPELRALESQVSKSEKSVELARKNQKFPDFMLGLQYWVAPDQSPKNMYTPMVALTIPFSPWTKGRHDYEVEEAIAERQMAKANLEAMRNMALSEVREMLAKVEAADKSLSFYQDGLLLQAQQSYGAAVAAYQTGQVNFMTLLDAQRTIRDSRLGYYKAMVDYEQSLADLDRAVGLDLSQFRNK
jgi:cobalt-zinc-cadmium efflux system outer membrane protein